MPFETSTRLKYIKLPVQTRPVGGGATSVDLPRSGLLGRIYLQINVTIAGGLSAPNVNGVPSCIRRVRLTLNKFQ